MRLITFLVGKPGAVRMSSSAEPVGPSLERLQRRSSS